MRRLLVLAVLVAASAGADVQAIEPYVGASMGRASLEDPSLDIGLDTAAEFSGSDTGYKLFAGFRFVRFLAIEGGVVDLGDISETVLGFRLEASIRGADAFLVVGGGPGKRLRFFGKVGYLYWEADTSATANGMRTDRSFDGSDLAYGLGIRVTIFKALSLRGELELFDLENVDRVTFGSLGFDFHF